MIEAGGVELVAQAEQPDSAARSGITISSARSATGTTDAIAAAEKRFHHGGKSRSDTAPSGWLPSDRSNWRLGRRVVVDRDRRCQPAQRRRDGIWFSRDRAVGEKRPLGRARADLDIGRKVMPEGDHGWALCRWGKPRASVPAWFERLLGERPLAAASGARRCRRCGTRKNTAPRSGRRPSKVVARAVPCAGGRAASATTSGPGRPASRRSYGCLRAPA